MPPFDKTRVAASFDRAACVYDAHAELQQTVVERLVERLDLVKLDPGRILDIGAGTGEGARLLAAKYRRAAIVQLDISRAMLEQSRQKHRSLLAQLFPRQFYITADAEHLPLSNNSIDLAFSSLTLQWCNDPDQAFAEASRVLRPDGLLLFASLGPDTLQELRQSWSVVDDKTHVNDFLDMHDIGDALVRAGLESVVMDVETITLTYDDCRQLMADLKTLGAENNNLDRPRGLTGRRRLQRVIEAYEGFRQDGKLPATYEIVYGHGWLGSKPRSRTVGNTSYVSLENLRRQKRP